MSTVTRAHLPGQRSQLWIADVTAGTTTLPSSSPRTC